LAAEIPAYNSLRSECAGSQTVVGWFKAVVSTVGADR
jgi:hypothetical protein